MDVKTIFFNRELNVEIYMQQPVGFVIKGQRQKNCKLQKSIYDFKQFSWQWYLKFHHSIISYDFTIINENYCVYVKCDDNNFIILSQYVDDILLASNAKDFISTTKEWLSSYFEIKDMSKAEFILDVKIQRNRSKKLIALSQVIH